MINQIEIEKLREKITLLKNNWNTQGSFGAFQHSLLSISEEWESIQQSIKAIENGRDESQIADVQSIIDDFNKFKNEITKFCADSFGKEIEETTNTGQISELEESIEYLRGISESHTILLRKELTIRQEFLENKKEIIRLFNCAKEVHKKFAQLYDDKSIPDSNKFLRLQSLSIQMTGLADASQKENNLFYILESVKSIKARIKQNDIEIDKLVKEIESWLSDCRNKIDPLRDAQVLVGTFYQQQRFYELEKLIEDLKKKHVNQVSIEELGLKNVSCDEALRVIRQKWIEFSVTKYKEYRQKVESRIRTEDPREILKDWQEATSKNLLTIDNVYQPDDRRTWFNFIKNLEALASEADTLEKKIEETKLEKPVTGLRKIISLQKAIEAHHYLENKYEERKRSLLHLSQIYLESSLKILRNRFKENKTLNSLTLQIRSVITEIIGLNDLEPYVQQLNDFLTVVQTTENAIRRLPANPQQAFAQITELKKTLSEKHYEIPLILKDKEESVRGYENPRQEAEKLIREIQAPGTPEDFESTSTPTINQNLVRITNVLEGIRKVKPPNLNAEQEKKEIIAILEQLAMKLEAARDYLLAREEIAMERPRYNLVLRWLKSAERYPAISGQVGEIRAGVTNSAEINERVRSVYSKVEKFMGEKGKTIEDLLINFEKIQDVEDQPSQYVQDLLILKNRLYEIIKKEAKKILVKLIEKPSQFTDEKKLNNIKKIFNWAKKNNLQEEYMNELDGVINEAEAWQALQRINLKSKEHNWDTIIDLWRNAAIHGRKEAALHALAALKAKAICEFLNHRPSTLEQDARSETLLRLDDDLTLLHARVLLDDLTQKYSDARIIFNEKKASEFDQVLNIISPLEMGKKQTNSDASNDDNPGSGREKIIKFNRIWNENYQKKIPTGSIPNSSFLRGVITEKKDLFEDLCAIARLLNADSRLADFYKGNQIAVKKINEYEQIKKKGTAKKKENAEKFLAIWQDLRTRILEDLGSGVSS